MKMPTSLLNAGLCRSKSNKVEQDCGNTTADDTDDSDIEPTEQSIVQHQSQIVNPTLLQHQVQIFDSKKPINNKKNVKYLR
ncbi:hypothetical protein JTB14_037556 [Gonioctena quinquepunctata]|nr:hypothetical protein JTB14_037556 [Gonioctena quinquepunctata]